MSPGYFVGIPDWRSALLAVAFAMLWLPWLSRSWMRSPWLWVTVGVAASLFSVSIAWIQVPIQQALNAFWTGLLSIGTIQRFVLLIGIPSLVAASLVQESVKLLVAIVVLLLIGKRRDWPAGLAMGAAAGAGYGGFEAFWVSNQIFSLGWSWAMVDLNGLAALLGFVERFLTVPFHIGATALAGYGFATGRVWRFLLLVVSLHTLANYSALMIQAGLTVVNAELWIAIVAFGTVGAALWVARRRGVGSAASLSNPRGG